MSRPWTDAEVKRVHQLTARGLTARQIGADLGRSMKSVTTLRERQRQSGGEVIKYAQPQTPDDIVQTVRDLAAVHCSAAQIAEQIGKTRNAVSGLCYRNGIVLRGGGGRRQVQRPKREERSGRSGGIATAIRAKRKAARPPELPRAEATDIAPEPGRPLVSFADLQPNQCRFPFGDPRQPGFGFCGKTALTDEKGNYKPYCAEHARVAYNG